MPDPLTLAQKIRLYARVASADERIVLRLDRDTALALADMAARAEAIDRALADQRAHLAAQRVERARLERELDRVARVLILACTLSAALAIAGLLS